MSLPPDPKSRTVIADTAVAKQEHLLEVDLTYGANRREGKRNKAKKAAAPMSTTNLRLWNIKTVIGHRCGSQLPDDDAGRDYLRVVIDHMVHYRPTTRDRKIAAFVATWCSWMSPDEVTMITDDAIDEKRLWTADKLGTEIGLLEAERTLLNITTFGAHTMTKAERHQRRGRLSALRSKAHREKLCTGRPPGRPRKTPNAAKSLLSLAAFGVISHQKQYPVGSTAVRLIAAIKRALSAFAPDAGAHRAPPTIGAM